MNTPKLTLQQKQFLERFDQYTEHGASPKQTRNLRDEWRVQHRTINKCYRLGFLKKAGIAAEEFVFVVNPNKREELGLAQQTTNIRKTRKRTSSIKLFA